MTQGNPVSVTGLTGLCAKFEQAKTGRNPLIRADFTDVVVAGNLRGRKRLPGDSKPGHAGGQGL